MALCRLVSAASQVGGRGKGARRLQGQNVGVVAVQPDVPETQRGVQPRLLYVGQERRSDGAGHLGRGLVARRLQGSHGGFGRSPGLLSRTASRELRPVVLV